MPDGILLFLIAIDMLFARPTGAKRTEAEEREAALTENPAVFPLAVPMIAGPGTIATVLLLVNLSRMATGSTSSIVALAYAVALFVTWLCMRGSSMLMRVIGTTGIHVISRLLGIILAALAVQFVLNGSDVNAAAAALIRRSRSRRPTARTRLFRLAAGPCPTPIGNPVSGSGKGIGCGGSLNGSEPGS